MLGRLACIQKLDIFGVAPAIRFQGGSKSYSHFGLMYTLLTGTFVIWSIVFTSQDFVHRTNPALITTTMFGETFHDDLVLNHDLFQLGFGIYENRFLGNYFIDPSIYTVTASMGLYNYYPDGTCILTSEPLDIVPCQNSNFDNQVNYYASQWCLSKTQANFDYLFTRTEDDQFIQIDFRFCNNATSGGTCAPQDVIDRWIIDSDIQTTFRQSTTIASNYKKPISHFYTDQWQGLLLDKTKSVKLMLDVVEFTSDDGWLFQSETTETIINFNPIAGDVLERREPDLFASFIIANSGNKILYHRTYMKIQDVLAQVSGLAAAAALILGFLAQPYAELKMYEKTVKDIYKINVHKKDPDSTYGINSPDQTQSQKIPINSTFVQSPINPELDMKSKDFSRSSVQKTSNPPFSLKTTIAEPEDNFITSDNNRTTTRPMIPQKKNLYPPNITTVHEHETETQLQDKVYDKENVKEFKSTLSIDIEKDDTLKRKKDIGGGEPFHSDIGYFQWLFSHVRFSPQISLLKKGKDEINRYLDLLVLVRKLREIDKLKVCLMQKEERVIFENSQQPSLSINTRAKARQVEVHECYLPYETSELRKIDEAYYRVKTRRNKTDFTEKLLLLYERDQKNL